MYVDDDRKVRYRYADVVFSRNVDKTKTIYRTSSALFNYYWMWDIRMAPVWCVSWRLLYVFCFFNLFLYCFVWILCNARIFLQKCHRKHFFSSSLLDVDNKVLTTNCRALFIFFTSFSLSLWLYLRFYCYLMYTIGT
jgi:hypothetical protein